MSEAIGFPDRRDPQAEFDAALARYADAIDAWEAKVDEQKAAQLACENAQQEVRYWADRLGLSQTTPLGPVPPRPT